MKGEDRPASVHADRFIAPREAYKAPALASRWEVITAVRKEVTKALENARKAKEIGHSLDASVTLGLASELMEKLRPYADQLRSVFIVSSVDMVEMDRMEDVPESETIEGLKVAVFSSSDPKCERCWVHDPTVGQNSNQPAICKRCQQSLAEME
jgi:isoleucyl-tRNA synthetase